MEGLLSLFQERRPIPPREANRTDVIDLTSGVDEQDTEILIGQFSTGLVGPTLTNGEIAPDTILQVVRDLGVVYDTNALAVHDNSRSIGYLPSAITTWLAPILDAGKVRLEAFFQREIRNSASFSRPSINIKIFLKTKSPNDDWSDEAQRLGIPWTLLSVQFNSQNKRRRTEVDPENQLLDQIDSLLYDGINQWSTTTKLDLELEILQQQLQTAKTNEKLLELKNQQLSQLLDNYKGECLDKLSNEQLEILCEDVKIGLNTIKKALQERKQLQYQCPICLDKHKEYALISCGHGYCKTCVNQLVDTCPVCRNKFIQKLKLY